MYSIDRKLCVAPESAVPATEPGSRCRALDHYPCQPNCSTTLDAGSSPARQNGARVVQTGSASNVHHRQEALRVPPKVPSQPPSRDLHAGILTKPNASQSARRPWTTAPHRTFFRYIELSPPKLGYPKTLDQTRRFRYMPAHDETRLPALVGRE